MKKHFLFLSAFLFLYVIAKAQTEVDITRFPGGIITYQYNDAPIGEDISKLTDNLDSTKFLTFHCSAWVQYKSPVPSIVHKYLITSGNDSPERDPSNWTLSGSNNGITFSTIDTRKNQTFDGRNKKREFTIIGNTKVYLFYRLSMTNNSGDILQLSEWELFGIKGKLSKELLADFAVEPALFAGTPVTLSNGSLNATKYAWRFEGGNPATSSETNPKVTFATPNTYSVTLTATTGRHTATKKKSIVVRDINDWSSFIYPTVTLECVNINNPGYMKFQTLAAQKGFKSIEDFVRNCCLVIAKELYYTVDEANSRNLRNIAYKLNEGGNLSAKGGSAPNIEIVFDMNYLNTFSQTHSDTASADEIYGVLCHEICHGYQREPQNAGVYGTRSENYGFIEGTADLARLLTGGFNPKRYPRVGGSWLDAYNTTAFFYFWIRNTKSPNFLKDLNKTTLTINPWSLDTATRQLIGESAQSLWDEYQSAIPSLQTATN